MKRLTMIEFYVYDCLENTVWFADVVVNMPN